MSPLIWRCLSLFPNLPPQNTLYKARLCPPEKDCSGTIHSTSADCLRDSFEALVGMDALFCPIFVCFEYLDEMGWVEEELGEDERGGPTWCCVGKRWSQGSGFGLGMRTSYWSVVEDVDAMLLRRILSILFPVLSFFCLSRSYCVRFSHQTNSSTERSLKV